MMIYYKLSGVIADFALILNIVLLFGAMASLNATLTLPGIAGIILAIGMAVDSNVLMFERIRDEIRAGKPPRSAVDSGYDKAFWHDLRFSCNNSDNSRGACSSSAQARSRGLPLP